MIPGNFSTPRIVSWFRTRICSCDPNCSGGPLVRNGRLCGRAPPRFLHIYFFSQAVVPQLLPCVLVATAALQLHQSASICINLHQYASICISMHQYAHCRRAKHSQSQPCFSCGNMSHGVRRGHAALCPMWVLRDVCSTVDAARNGTKS